MTDSDDDLLILNGKSYRSERSWAKKKQVTQRTVARHRQLGLPWLDWAQQIWIPETEGDEYLASLVKRRNPPRRRRQAAATAEIGAP